MGYPYFIFNGKDSRDYNIIINKLPPIHFIENEVEELTIPGRDGVLTIDQGRKEALSKPFQITIYPDDFLQEIRQWLRGEGEITFSNEPDVFYKGRFESVKEVEGATNEKVVSLTFRCDPWGYFPHGQNTIAINTKGTKLVNRDEEAKPLIEVVGTGAIELIVNGKKAKFVGSIIIDSEIKASWYNINEKSFSGDYPIFKKGENTISWNGNVSRVEVTPRWRR